jgi:hypothetical protein
MGIALGETYLSARFAPQSLFGSLSGESGLVFLSKQYCDLRHARTYSNLGLQFSTLALQLFHLYFRVRGTR